MWFLVLQSGLYESVLLAMVEMMLPIDALSAALFLLCNVHEDLIT